MDTAQTRKSNPEMVPPKASYETIYPALATMFDYPNEDSLHNIQACSAYLSQQYPEAFKEIQAFTQRARDLTLEAWQEAYTRTFDMAPICCPYVSAYIY